MNLHSIPSSMMKEEERVTENILEIHDLSKSFGKNHVLKNINLSVKRGTVRGLMGENGAGKSTRMKCLFGIYAKDDGSIIFDDKNVNFENPKDALENGVAMVHQELNQCLDRTVLDNRSMKTTGYVKRKVSSRALESTPTLNSAGARGQSLSVRWWKSLRLYPITQRLLF